MNLFIIHLAIICLNISSVVSDDCPPINPSQNVEIDCQNQESRQGRTVKICKFKCKSFYVPFEGSSLAAGNEIFCSNGTWENLQKFKSFACTEDCGRRLTNPKPFIVHGAQTNSSTWPWHAALFTTKKIDSSGNHTWFYICGGSLIRNNVILTAAHCVSSVDGLPRRAELFRIVLGARSTEFVENQENPFAQVFEVKNVHVSPSYDPRKEFQADIAVLHLDGNGVRFNDLVLPVCLPNEYALDVNALNPGKFGDLIGFGIDESGNSSKTLKHASLMVVSQSECFSTLERVLSESQFCAGNRLGDKYWMTVCNGDSGGGFVHPSSVLQRYFIHGIISSGSPTNGQLVCQKYAVFTRVFQFIFWIRDILEQIQGEVLRELASSSKYHYIQQGSETEPGQFYAIPREWDNLVTTVQLTHFDIEPDVFFTSLQNNRGIQVLNLTDIRFTAKLLPHHRVLLPHMKSFVLDISEFDSSRTFFLGDVDFGMNNAQLKSLIFFDKDHQGWDLKDLTHLRTDIELSVTSHRILTLNFEKGKLNIIYFGCSEIIENSSPEFVLQHLSLQLCELSVSLIRPAVLRKVKSLITHSVSLRNGSWSELLSKMPILEELRLTHSKREKNAKRENTIFLSSLPRTLKHLAVLKYRVSVLQSPSQILFVSPGLTFDMFPAAETFVCFFCILSADVLENFARIFENVKHITFRGEQPLNLTHVVESLKNVNTILVDLTIKTTLEVEEGIFLGLDELRPKNVTPGSVVQFLWTQGTRKWVLLPHEKQVLYDEYKYGGWENFHTSSDDYQSRNRLRSFEVAALKTGHYKFGSETVTKRLPRFPKIPTEIHSSLKSIRISNAEILPPDLIESLTNATNLESLILDNVRLLGAIGTHAELPRLKHYKLNRLVRFHSFETVTTEANVNLLIPFGFEIEPYNAGLFETFDYARFNEPGTMETFEISDSDCICVRADYKNNIFISSIYYSHQQNTLRDLAMTNLTKIAISVSSYEWSTMKLPATLTDVYIVDPEPSITSSLSPRLQSLIKPLQSLTSLRLILYFNETVDGINLWLSDLSPRLEYFAITGVRIKYSKEVSFPYLRSLFLENCIFDEQIVTHFFDIFPNVQNISILSYNYEEGSKLELKYLTMNTELLINAMTNSSGKILRILASLAFPKEIKRTLNIQRNWFVLGKKNTTWVPIELETSEKNMTQHELFLLEIKKLRSDLVFGPSCPHNKNN